MLRPSLLLSRDRAILKLRRKASARGVRIERPEVWQWEWGACTPTSIGEPKND